MIFQVTRPVILFSAKSRNFESLILNCFSFFPKPSEWKYFIRDHFFFFLHKTAHRDNRVRSKVESEQRLKNILDTALLNTQRYKVQIKGKVEQSMEKLVN